MQDVDFGKLAVSHVVGGGVGCIPGRGLVLSVRTVEEGQGRGSVTNRTWNL